MPTAVFVLGGTRATVPDQGNITAFPQPSSSSSDPRGAAPGHRSTKTTPAVVSMNPKKVVERKGLRFVHAAIVLLGLAGAASAQVLDEFDSPSPGWTRTATGAPGSAAATSTVCEAGLPVPGGARDVNHRAYGNPKNSISAVGVGDGRLSVAQGVGLTAETLILYGAFTRVGCDAAVGGPLLNLDLSADRSMRLAFSGAEDGLNLNVTYYTSNPLNSAVPLYYATAGINVAPSSSGGPIEAHLPLATDPGFNWKRVDGIAIVINRAGPTPHTSYTLDQVLFSTAP